MSDKVFRMYAGEDSFMIESSEVMQAALADDLADFTDFDSTIDADFLAAWAAANTAARATTADFTVMGEQKDRTALVNAAMQQCRDAYNDIMYFAKKAFKNNAELLLKFGRGNEYRKAYASQRKMTFLMEEMSVNVTTYTSQLTTAGASATVLGAPAAAFTALSALNINQQGQIKDRRLFTRERVEAYNAAYNFMALVIEAAQSVYRNNADMRNIYTYNPIISGNDNLFTGTLAPAEIRVVIAAGIISLETNLINVENTGNTNIRVDVLPAPGTPAPDATELPPQNAIAITGPQLPPDLPQYLLVIQNLSDTEEGEYRVEIEE